MIIPCIRIYQNSLFLSTHSFLSTDDTLNYQSSSEIKRRIFLSTDKSSQLTEVTTADPEGIPDDLMIISVILVLNGVAGQKCSLFIKMVSII